MKIKRILAVASLLAAGTAVAGGSNFNVLFSFDGGTGNQVFRSAAGAPTLNTVAGVAPAGAPWLISEFDAVIRKNGDVMPTILLDGVVAGTWWWRRRKDVATLEAESFVKLTKAARADLEREAELALAVLEPAATRFEVEVVG